MDETIKITISLDDYPVLVALANAQSVTPEELIRRMLVTYEMGAVIEWEETE